VCPTPGGNNCATVVEAFPVRTLDCRLFYDLSDQPTQALQVRQDKTPFDDRIVVDPVATMNGDAIVLESAAVAPSQKAAWAGST
jgi:hypothetical protein